MHPMLQRSSSGAHRDLNNLPGKHVIGWSDGDSFVG